MGKLDGLRAVAEGYLSIERPTVLRGASITEFPFGDRGICGAIRMTVAFQRRVDRGCALLAVSYARGPPYLGQVSRLALSGPFGNFSARSWERGRERPRVETNSNVQPRKVLARRRELLDQRQSQDAVGLP
jgi:hypothetical protein